MKGSMNNKKRYFVLSIFLFFSRLIYSQQVLNEQNIKILTVKSNNEATLYELYMTCDEELNGMNLKMFDTAKRDWTNFDFNLLEKQGVPLKEVGKRKVILLRSNDFLRDRGGNFKLDYLVSGIDGSRNVFSLEVEFDGTTWKVYHEGREVYHLDFIVNKKLLVGTVGIKKVLPKFR